MNIADYIKNGILCWPNWVNTILLLMNVFGKHVYGRKYCQLIGRLDCIDEERKLLELVNFAIQHVEYYRKRYHNVKIETIGDFERKIGFIDKDEVMKHWDEFLVDNLDLDRCIQGTTGGTSGKPLKLVVPKDRYALELAYMHRIWKRYGWNYHLRGVIRNHHLKGKNYAINPVTRELVFDAFRTDDEYVGCMVDTMRRMGVRFVQAYPSSAYQFCKSCDRLRCDIQFIRCFMCGSEGVTPEQAEYFDRKGIEICTWYGHSEKLILASYSAEHEGFVVEPGYGYMELADKEGNLVSRSGQLGEMVGSTLYNRFMPLIRYRTGDFTSYKSCSPEKVLEKIQGRWENSLIKKQDGTFTSLTQLNVHGDFNEHIDGMQYVQEEPGKLKVLVIKGESWTSKDEDFLLEHIGKTMGGREYVKIDYVNELVMQNNGKFLPLIKK